MHKKLVVVLLLVSIVGCKSKTAFNYSENFVKKEQSLALDIKTAETSVAAYNASGQYDSIAIVGERMEKLFDSKLNEIETEPAPDVKEGENFKKAGIQYFKFLKSIYTRYKEFGNAKTPEDREMILSKLKDLIAQKETVVSDIKQAQKKYADANGFKVKD